MKFLNRCPHANIRGVYGDEIIFAANWRRLCCIDCGRYLDGDLELANVDYLEWMNGYLEWMNGKGGDKS